MTPDSKRSHWLLERFTDILVSAVDRNPDGVFDGIIAVSDRYGDDGMYGVCCALAETVLKLGFPGIERGDGSLEGNLVVVQQLNSAGSADPPTLWACRFVASYINGDTDSNVHLFFSSRDETDFLSRATMELVAMAADMARHKRDELQAERP